MNKYGLEAKENWIAARIDELMDDEEWLKSMSARYEVIKESVLVNKARWIKSIAEDAAEREHAAIMADLEDERINLHRGDYDL